MDENEISWLIESSDRLVGEVPTAFHRALYGKIDWSERLICLKGARGVGKTTLLLQHVRERYGIGSREALFVSLDSFWFETHHLVEVADWHWKHGGTCLVVDEVHHREQWPTLIKTVYDAYPHLKIIYSGSSMLKLDTEGGDLSRRQMTYELPGLSFREFLAFEGILNHQALSLRELLENHASIATDIARELRILEPFFSYLRYGYYPFYCSPGITEVCEPNYFAKIRQVVTQILEVDYPKIEEVTVSTIRKARRMLAILAESVPQTPRMAQLYRELETDRVQGLKILCALQHAGLLNLLSDEAASLKNLSRPDKILLNNTNLMRALAGSVNVGCIRETFFLNQLRGAGYDVTYPKVGDFVIDGRFLFEVGGSGKSFEQIKDVPDSFLAVDDMEIGRGNRLPLWLFGFLY